MSPDEQTANGLQVLDPPGKGGALEGRRVSVNLGIAPKSLDEGWRLAQLMAQSSLVPKGYLGKPADVLVAIELGMEVGFAPMQALQSIAVINGRPSLWGDGFLALLMASSHYQDHEEYFLVDNERREDLAPDDLKKDTTTAVCTFWRKGKPKPVTATFSIGKAKKAGLWTKEGPWQNYPDRMLKMRARGFAGRDCFPDVLRGIRTAEESRDQPDGEVVVELPGGLPAFPQPAQRKSQQAAQETTEAPLASTAAGTPAEKPTAPAGADRGDSAPSTAPAAAGVAVGVTVTAIDVKPGGTLITFSSGLRAATKDEALVRGAEMAKGANLRVHVETRDPKDPRNAPVLVKITPVDEEPAS